jgi:hypothetical protein
MILKSNKEFIRKLSEWLPDRSNWTLCWRASQYGWLATDFHSNCDDNGATVTIISVQDGKYIFGGYSDVAWGGMEKCKFSESETKLSESYLCTAYSMPQIRYNDSMNYSYKFCSF